jgi:hypothetical protein
MHHHETPTFDHCDLSGEVERLKLAVARGSAFGLVVHGEYHRLPRAWYFRVYRTRNFGSFVFTSPDPLSRMRMHVPWSNNDDSVDTALGQWLTCLCDELGLGYDGYQQLDGKHKLIVWIKTLQPAADCC